mgnify:CR=1 FL=1
MSPEEPIQLKKFTDLPLKETLAQAIHKAGYRDPRPIQAESIPPAIEGRDILGLAQTGTGKTAAFAISSITSFLRKTVRGPRVVVLAASRALVL